jgi:hypothetical protein
MQQSNTQPAKQELGFEILNIGANIPTNWSYTITQNFTGDIIPHNGYSTIKTENSEELSLPHGLGRPVAIVNFTNPTALFEVAGGVFRHPSLWLYFYNITEKEEIMGIIDNESIYSWCVPLYFNETDTYIIVTSPCYINSGVFTEEAQKYYSPLEKSLKEYFTEFK